MLAAAHYGGESQGWSRSSSPVLPIALPGAYRRYKSEYSRGRRGRRSKPYIYQSLSFIHERRPDMKASWNTMSIGKYHLIYLGYDIFSPFDIFAGKKLANSIITVVHENSTQRRNRLLDAMN